MGIDKSPARLARIGIPGGEAILASRGYPNNCGANSFSLPWPGLLNRDFPLKKSRTDNVYIFSPPLSRPFAPTRGAEAQDGVSEVRRLLLPRTRAGCIRPLRTPLAFVGAAYMRPGLRNSMETSETAC